MIQERPLLFSAPMVRAILEGRKTQTRRLLKPPPGAARAGHIHYRPGALDDPGMAWWWDGTHDRVGYSAPLPYQPGMRIWVRETWRYDDWTEDGQPWVGYAAGHGHRLCDPPEEWAERCGDTWAWLSRPENYARFGRAADPRWRSPIHMPRWASRLTLTITDVRVQRLRDISTAEAIAEGATSRPACYGFQGREKGWSMDWSRVGQLSRYASRPPGQRAPAPLTERDVALSAPQWAFVSYWNEIHGAGAWEANPWVVAITFERVAPP